VLHHRNTRISKPTIGQHDRFVWNHLQDNETGAGSFFSTRAGFRISGLVKSASRATPDPCSPGAGTVIG